MNVDQPTQDTHVSRGTKTCSKPGCTRVATSYGRYCRPCFNAAQRKSQARKRGEVVDDELRLLAAIGSERAP